MNSTNSAVDIVAQILPVAAIFAWNAGDAHTFAISALSCATIAYGVPAGAIMPVQVVIS